jgi:hypothetical protein
MARHTNTRRRSLSKYAKRRQSRKSRSGKSEAELRMAKNIRERARRKRNRALAEGVNDGQNVHSL